MDTFFHAVDTFSHGGDTFSHGIPSVRDRTPAFFGERSNKSPDTDNFDKAYTLELNGMAQHAGGGQGLHPAAAFPFRHLPLSHPLYAITPPASQGTQAG